MSAMASQITGVSIFTQPFVQAQVKENIKAPRHWPLWGEFTGPAQRASKAENVSIWWRRLVIMTIPSFLSKFLKYQNKEHW